MRAIDKLLFALALACGAAAGSAVGCATPCPGPEEFDFSLRSTRYVGSVSSSRSDTIAGYPVDDGRIELDVDAEALAVRLSFASDGQPVVVGYEITNVDTPH